MAIRKISEFVEASSPQNSDKLLIERNGSGKSITVGNLLNDLNNKTRINYLRPVLRTITKNGITCTDNGDGTYTINGTASKYTEFTIGRVHIEKNKKYKVVGCPSGGTYEPDVGYKLFIAYDDTYAVDYGESETFEPTRERISDAAIQVNTGTVCDNLLFKPMITDDLSAMYDDFVSYNDSFITGINSGIKLDLLWANEDPHTPFVEQTLALNISDYKLLVIVSLPNSGNINNMLTNLFVVSISENRISLSYYDKSATLSRVFTLNDSSIIISNATLNGSVDNNKLIPYGIYGVR